MVDLTKIAMYALKRGAAALCLLVAIFASTRAWAAVPSPGDGIVNTVTVDYSDNAGYAMDTETDTVTVTATGPSSLSVGMTDAPDPVYAGNEITYTITVTNDGASPLTGVGLADTIPANTTFVSADSGGVLSSGTVSWAIGGLGVGESAVVHLVVRVDAAAPDAFVINDSVTASSNETGDDIADTDTTVAGRTQGMVRFVDSSGNPVDTYTVGGTVYVLVDDADQNFDPSVPETVTVVIVSHHKEPGGTESVLDSVTVTLTETGPDTGVFGGSVPTDSGPPNPSDSVLTVETDTSLLVTYTDPLDPVPSTDDSAFIDPFGVVFDSETGDPVEGAAVTLIDDDTGLAAVLPQPPDVPYAQLNPVTTGPDGSFQFQYVGPGTYRLLVEPPEPYSFPSAVPTPELPPGYVVTVGSRGEDVTLAAGMGALNLDVPVDPSGGELGISKTADVKVASIGDIVLYTVRVTNTGTGPVDGITVHDIMPHGVVYLKGSTTMDGIKAPDPAPYGDRGLTWDIGLLMPGGERVLTYRALVGPDSDRGDGLNIAYAQGRAGGVPVVSRRASHRMEISRGVFTDRGTLIGKVFSDLNMDGEQQDGEPGLPGVALYMEDGTRVVTDRDGKYSVYGVMPGTHAIKVDTITLPDGAMLLMSTNRSAGVHDSQFVDMSPGLMFMANFAVGGVGEVRVEAKAESPPAVPDKAGGGKEPDAVETAVPAPDTPADKFEELIRDMTPELGILEPSDGLVHVRDSIDVTVKSHSEATLVLYVNGKEVDASRIGKKIELASKKVVISTYIAVPLEPGKTNVIRAEMKDPFGNTRGTDEVSVIVPGRPARLEVSPEGPEVPADGETVTEFSVSVYDLAGNLVTGPGTLTVTATGGEILNEDADKSANGVQLVPEMGRATVRLRSARAPGESEVGFVCGGARAKVKVYFTPHLRDIMAVGVGEAVVGYGHARGDTRYLERDGWFDRKLYTGGRGAFFAKGHVGAGILATVSYDSEKKKEDVEFFREKTGNVESEELYPIYGDESKLGYEAMSSDKLYMRLDRGRSHVMYGDFRTGLDRNRLTAYNRTFTGVKAEVNEGILRLDGFATRTDRSHRVEKFQGKGIAGYYYLGSSPVVEGSELVLIETRDRLLPERVVKRVTMQRWSSYNIDYENGTILFKEPIPSRDDDLNPVYVIVSYESDGADINYVYGGRASVRPLKWLEAGFTGVVEEDADYDYVLIGADTTLTLPYDTELKAEWARSDSPFKENNTYTTRAGNAWELRIKSAPFKGLRLAGAYYKSDDRFRNENAVDVAPGKQGVTAEFEYDITEDTKSRGRFLREEDNANDGRHLYASAGVETRFGDTKAGADIVHETSRDGFVPKASPNTRFPMDISEETPGRLTALRLFFETKVLKDLLFSAEHNQDIMHNRNNMTQAGFDYQYSPGTKFYIREQYVTYDDRSQLRTVIGVESNVTDNTQVFSEYRLLGGAPGYRNQYGVGLRNKFTLAEGITGNLSVENLSTLTGPEKQNEPDAFAFSAGLEYLPLDDLKASTRVEYRDSSTSVSRLAELNLDYKLHRDLSMFTRGRYYDERGIDAGKRTKAGSVLGLAYRPVPDNRFNALAKAEFRHEVNPVNGCSISSDNYIFSAEGTYQPYRSVQLALKYAGKYVQSAGYGSYVDLVSTKLTCDVTDKLDVGVTYRMMTGYRADSRLQGGAVELGYNVFRNIWLSVGYSFDRFDSDLTGDDYQGDGPYFKVRAKLTENLFR